MRITKRIIALFPAVALVLNVCANTPPGAPVDTRVELLKDAYSINTTDPSFSWAVQDEDKNETQSAYRIVFSQRLSAVAGKNYLFDSGWVLSGNNTGVKVEGLSSKLKPNSLYYWQVQTRDGSGAEGPLSEPQPFTTEVQWANTDGIWLEPKLVDYGNTGGDDGDIYYEDILRLDMPGTPVSPSPLSKWTNYRVEQDVTITSTALGIVFRANGNDNYMWQFRADNNTIQPHWNYTNSYNTPVNLSDHGVQIQLNVPFHLRIDVIGNELITYINDIKVYERTGRNYSVGTIGYRTGQFEAGTVDNIVVANLNTGEIIYAEDFSGGTSAYSNCTVSAGALNVAKSTATCLAVENDLTETTVVDEKANFVFLRHKFQIEDITRVEKAIVAATATNTESAKQHVFDLLLNDQSVGVGPARNQNNTPQGNLQYYNTYDVTALLQNGSNAIAAVAYNKDANRAFLLQMAVYYTDGTSEILINSARDAAQWKGKDGTLAFGQNDEYNSVNIYKQHKEHMNALKYPFGFAGANYTEDHTWREVKQSGAVYGNRILVPYTSENSLRFLMPASEVVKRPTGNGNYVITLEKAIVGGLQLDINSPAQTQIEVHYGEDLNDDGSVKNIGRGHPNYIEYWTLKQGEQSIKTLNMKNFRYVQILNSPVEITPDNVKGYAIRQPFDDTESEFTSSNSFLNELYEFTKYSIKATNQDKWVDSQARERLPYEGDAIVNMTSSNAFITNYSLGRHTHEYLINNQTWPQEYKLFSVELAWLDYLYTGDRRSIDEHYAKLKNKFPGSFNAGLGLINLQNDVLVDWPAGERDNYSFQAYNTGYNAMYVGACEAMANIAALVGNETDRLFYQNRAKAIKKSLIEKLYNAQTGAFDDALTESGALSGHYSQHATAYALAYGIYDSEEMAEKMAAFIDGQGGFKTSVYGAYFVLRGLYNAGAGDTAMKFMADEDANKVRTWAHMLHKLNATISTEAWDPANKPNMTFSHAWGSAPASGISAGMFGIQPIDPGFETFRIKIQPGDVQSASINVPTLRGTIEAAYQTSGGKLELMVKIPANTKAFVSLPADSAYAKLIVDGSVQLAEREGKFLTVPLGSGTHQLAVSDEIMPYCKVVASILDNEDAVLRPGNTGWINVSAITKDDVLDQFDNVTFASSDESVVTVSATGELQAAGVGKATITVIVKHGSLEGQATISVRVTDSPFPGDDKIQTVEIRLGDMPVEGKTLTPALIGVLGDGTEIVFENVKYISENENVARVNADGSVTFLAAGEFTLKALTDEHFEKLIADFDFDRFEITPLYTNDFHDSANPFTGVTTNMSAGNGRLFVGKSTNAIYAGGTEWTDYIITATINPVAGTGSPTQPGGPAATFHFRSNADRTQLYMWQLFCGNSLKKHINISETGSVITPIDGMKPAGEDNHVAIAAEGNRIMTYINGKLVDVAEYTNYSKGTFGVRTGSYEEFYLDDLVVGSRKLCTRLTDTVRLSAMVDVPANDAPFVNIFTEKGKIEAHFNVMANIRLYSIAGLLLDEATANSIYTCNVAQGVYVLSVGGEPYKIVVR